MQNNCEYTGGQCRIENYALLGTSAGPVVLSSLSILRNKFKATDDPDKLFRLANQADIVENTLLMIGSKRFDGQPCSNGKMKSFISNPRIDRLDMTVKLRAEWQLDYPII